MGRWKTGPEGPQWDANDSGPDQVQGMPPGGPQAGAPNYGGNTGVNGGNIGMGGQVQPNASAQGQANGQPFQGGGFNPPNAWAQPEEKEVPGWGPIKISTHFQPGEGYPHPFENGFAVGDKSGSRGLWGGPGHPDPDDPNYKFPSGPQYLPQLPDNGGPFGAILGQPQNTAGTPTPNPGESYQDMFSRYLNDYHAPDRNDVMSNIFRNDPNPIMAHTMDQANIPGFPGAKGNGLMSQLIQRLMQQQPLPPGGVPEPKIGDMVPNGWGGMVPWDGQLGKTYFT